MNDTPHIPRWQRSYGQQHCRTRSWPNCGVAVLRILRAAKAKPRRRTWSQPRIRILRADLRCIEVLEVEAVLEGRALERLGQTRINKRLERQTTADRIGGGEIQALALFGN